MRRVAGIVTPTTSKRFIFPAADVGGHPVDPGSHCRWYQRNESVLPAAPAHTFFHSSAQSPLHFLGLTAKHGGLVGNTNGDEMQVWIKTIREALEPSRKDSLVSTLKDIVTNQIRFFQSECYKIVPLEAVACELVALVSS